MVPTLDQVIGTSKKPLRIPLPDRAAKWYALSAYRAAILEASGAANAYDGLLLDYQNAGAQLPAAAARVGPSESGRDAAWDFYRKHAAAIQAQNAYQIAQGIVLAKQHQDTSQMRAHVLRQYGPLMMDHPAVAASHDALSEAGVPHSMPLVQFIPPTQGYPTATQQYVTTGQAQVGQFPTYEEINGAGRFQKQLVKLSPAQNMTYETARKFVVEPTNSS